MAKSEAHQITIRMGAAHWDAKVAQPAGAPIHFDIRAMDRGQKRAFFRTFSSSFRQVARQRNRKRGR